MKNKKMFKKMKDLDRAIMRYLTVKKDFFPKIAEDERAILVPPTSSQMDIIDYILEHMDEEIYQKDLEEALNVSRATISGILQTMEKNHLIERYTDSIDTRTKKVKLNEMAKNIYLRNESVMSNFENLLIKDISEEELETFSIVLDKMKANVKI